jgi:exodeoxyribonuclease VII small subunit
MAKAPASGASTSEAPDPSEASPVANDTDDDATGLVGDGPAAEFADVAALSYEDARDELSSIVARLEGGQVPLEEGMRLWRRGEALAAHCTAWLDGAQRQISGAGPASAP